jgi:hypothetical protein
MYLKMIRNKKITIKNDKKILSRYIHDRYIAGALRSNDVRHKFIIFNSPVYFYCRCSHCSRLSIFHTMYENDIGAKATSQATTSRWGIVGGIRHYNACASDRQLLDFVPDCICDIGIIHGFSHSSTREKGEREKRCINFLKYRGIFPCILCDSKKKCFYLHLKNKF